MVTKSKADLNTNFTSSGSSAKNRMFRSRRRAASADEIGRI